jgi:hypothetical protein
MAIKKKSIKRYIFIQLTTTDTRLVFCNRKLMRTDIFFTRTTKPICIFANSGVVQVACPPPLKKNGVGRLGIKQIFKLT